MCRNPRAVAGLAAVLLAAGALYARGLHAGANYDEGVYLASLDALTHGQSLGTEVYASQPPGFYVALQALSLLPGDGVVGIRVAFLLIALLGIVAAYAIGCRFAAMWGGLGSAALLAVTAPYPVQAPRVQADTVSVVLALAAVAALMHARNRVWRAGLAGILAGAALSVKVLALPVVVPLAVLLVARRSVRSAGAVVAGALAVWVVLAVAYAGALDELWRSVVTDHRAARDLGPTLGDNLRRVLEHPLDWKTPAAVLVVAGLACAAVFHRRVEMWALFSWIAAAALFLVLQQPLLDHHFVLLATVLAVTAGGGLGGAVERLPRPGRYAVAGIAALALAVGVAQEARRLARQDGEPSAVRNAAAVLRAATTRNELVASDLPMVAYLADRRLPGQLVDTSFVRLETESLTDGGILATLDREHVRAVAVGREFAKRPALLAALRSRYPSRTERDGITIFRAP